MNPLVLLLVLPIAEIAVFIEVGGWIGAGPTVALVILATLVGSVLLRWQGLSVLRRAQAAADRGELPVGAVFEGFCIVTAAILLIVPGFLTDVVGLLLFVPFLRNALGRWLFERMRRQGGTRIWINGRPMHRPGGGGRTPPGVIDGDYREVGEETAASEAPRIGGSRWGRPGSRPGHDDT